MHNANLRRWPLLLPSYSSLSLQAISCRIFDDPRAHELMLLGSQKEGDIKKQWARFYAAEFHLDVVISIIPEFNKSRTGGTLYSEKIARKVGKTRCAGRDGPLILRRYAGFSPVRSREVRTLLSREEKKTENSAWMK